MNFIQMHNKNYIKIIIKIGLKNCCGINTMLSLFKKLLYYTHIQETFMNSHNNNIIMNIVSQLLLWKVHVVTALV